MSYDTYKILHITGLLLVFLGLGSVLLQGHGSDRSSRFPLVLHGIGLLVLLVTAVGMLHKLGKFWPMDYWMFGKFGIWVFVGALPALHKRKVVPTELAWIVAIGAGVLAAWLAIAKPGA